MFEDESIGLNSDRAWTCLSDLQSDQEKASILVPTQKGIASYSAAPQARESMRAPRLNLLTLQTTKECNLRCRYCYLEPGDIDRGRLSVDVTRKILRDIVGYHVQNEIDTGISVVFHGGEPLLLGHDYFGQVFAYQSELEAHFAIKSFSNSIQSNITLLDEEYCEMFKDRAVSIGTSIDGPAFLHDRNRGAQTPRSDHAWVMNRVRLARDHGISVGAICVVTKDKLGFAEEILTFFEEEQMSFKVNKLFVNGMAKHNKGDVSTTPEEYATFMKDMFDAWYGRSPRVVIENLMEIMGLVLVGRGAGNCASSNCATRHVTLCHDGDLYTCGRTTQDPSFRLGNVNDMTMQELADSSALATFASRVPSGIQECAQCDVSDACFGGCMYEAYLNSGTVFAPEGNCDVFRDLYRHVESRILADLSSH